MPSRRPRFPTLTGYQKAATISACGLYRFVLFRRWDTRPMLLVVMNNPSTADDQKDDPTVTLLMHIASHNGYGGIVIVNLCPLRSPTMAHAAAFLAAVNSREPMADRVEAMRKNLEMIEEELDRADAVLIAWGAQGWRAENWGSRVEALISEAGKPVYRIGVCANGHPKHPLARGKHKVPKTARLQLVAS